MPDKTAPQTLEEWRIALDFEALNWLQTPQHHRDTYAKERERQKRARTRRDRRYFGEELWVKQSTSPSSEGHGARGLPQFGTEMGLAEWLEIPLTRLRWFTHDNPAESAWHYHRTVIPKRSGGKRVILAPKPELKALQRRVLDDLLVRFQIHQSAHGFVPGRSIVTNAAPHVNKAYIAKLDIKDFFPSIHVMRVQGYLAQFYNASVAMSLALLMSEYDREAVPHRGKMYHIALGQRHLVQGAPTSPMMANIIMHKADRRLYGLAKKLGFDYTRYADDLTFSGASHETAVHLLSAATSIIEQEGFRVNPKKVRILSRATRQHVTGVIVNEKLSSPRETRRTLRAILHNAQQTGLAAQNRDGHPAFREYLRGLIAHLHNINPEQAAQLLAQLEALS